MQNYLWPNRFTISNWSKFVSKPNFGTQKINANCHLEGKTMTCTSSAH